MLWKNGENSVSSTPRLPEVFGISHKILELLTTTTITTTTVVVIVIIIIAAQLPQGDWALLDQNVTKLAQEFDKTWYLVSAECFLSIADN